MINWLQPKRTPEEILEQDLNIEGETSWTVGPGYHTLIKAEFKDSNEELSFDLHTGAVVKSFINARTGELKTYVINYLDIEERPSDK